jgi:hypothetical protein
MKMVLSPGVSPFEQEMASLIFMALMSGTMAATCLVFPSRQEMRLIVISAIKRTRFNIDLVRMGCVFSRIRQLLYLFAGAKLHKNC